MEITDFTQTRNRLKDTELWMKIWNLQKRWNPSKPPSVDVASRAENLHSTNIVTDPIILKLLGRGF